MINKPGCFGAASVFAHDSTVCRECPVFDACAVESLKTLETIKGLVNVSDLIKRHEAAKAASRIMARPAPVLDLGAAKEAAKAAAKEPAEKPIPTIDQPVVRNTPIENVTFSLAMEDEKILATLPVKPEKLARRLLSCGLIDKIRTELQAGRNALATSSPRYVGVAIDCLLAGGFSRSDLRERYETELEWSGGTASSHVSIVIPVLLGFGLAQEVSGRIVASPQSVS